MRKKQKSILVLAIAAAFVATTLFWAGLIQAGDLEPSGPPGPTMKTLEEVYPAWSKKITDYSRFELVMDGAAVLDKETALVWPQSYDAFTDYTWAEAHTKCLTATIGGRLGWRLPTPAEVATLFDPTAGYPWWPIGWPFSGNANNNVWTETTDPSDPTKALYFSFTSGGLSVYPQAKTSGIAIWCVRGGH